jgi:hypothetical protein
MTLGKRDRRCRTDAVRFWSKPMPKNGVPSQLAERFHTFGVPLTINSAPGEKFAPQPDKWTATSRFWDKGYVGALLGPRQDAKARRRPEQAQQAGRQARCPPEELDVVDARHTQVTPELDADWPVSVRCHCFT